MKIRDYVRTEYGISKIIGIFPERTMIFIETDNGLGNCNSSQNGKLRKGIVVLKEDYRNFIDNNVKKEPIDLIQAGDYVNGVEVENIDDEWITMSDTKVPILKSIASGFIKSIVTKEQFENMKYKVEE